MTRRKPIRHGTVGGARAHFRHGVPMCEPCRAATRTARGYEGPQPVARCGTVAGYRKHRRAGEDACDACRAANAVAGRYYKLPPEQRTRELAEAAGVRWALPTEEVPCPPADAGTGPGALLRTGT